MAYNVRTRKGNWRTQRGSDLRDGHFLAGADVSKMKRGASMGVGRKRLAKGISRRGLIVGATLFATGTLAGFYLYSASGSQAETLKSLRQLTHYHGIAVDRRDPRRLLLATHNGFYLVNPDGQVLRTSPVQDFMGFTPHPSAVGVLYASGHPAGGGALGLIRSNDNGLNWKQISLGLGGPVDFHAMDASPVDPNVIYGSFHGIQVSRDGGISWEQAGPAPEKLVGLAASRSSADRIYAATQNGLLLSTDAGKSWTTAAFGGETVSMVSMGPGSKVYAFVVGKGLQEGNDDALNSWTELSTAFGDQVLLHFAVDPKDPARLYSTTNDNVVLASTDGGHSWRPFGGG